MARRGLPAGRAGRPVPQATGGAPQLRRLGGLAAPDPAEKPPRRSPRPMALAKHLPGFKQPGYHFLWSANSALQHPRKMNLAKNFTADG